MLCCDLSEKMCCLLNDIFPEPPVIVIHQNINKGDEMYQEAREPQVCIFYQLYLAMKAPACFNADTTQLSA
jgi:hypothetical protein